MANKKNQNQRERLLITQENPRSAVAEAYRTLRTNMGFTEMDKPCRTVLITSPHPREGKSTTASNLAVVMAQAGHNVLLVDCDLRKPLQHMIFKVSNQSGLTTCLRGKTTVQEAAHTNISENLSVLTSGPIPPNPSEVLTSEPTRRFWGGLAQQYDYVFVDSPPVLAVSDASILSAQMDGVLLVVNSGNTRIDHAQEARDQLIKANAHIIGVVLNQVKMAKGQYDSYYYSSDASM